MQFDRQAFIKDAEPLIASFGLILWGVEYLPAGKKSILRIYVDAPPVETAPDNPVEHHDEDEGMILAQGVLLDQCAQVSRHLSVLLDAEDLVPGAYTLEVSSPGLSRPFFHLDQMEGYVGQELELTTREPVIEGEHPGRKRFSGQLVAVDPEKGQGGGFSLIVDSVRVDFSWDQVKKIHLVHQFPDSSPKKGGKRKKNK